MDFLPDELVGNKGSIFLENTNIRHTNRHYPNDWDKWAKKRQQKELDIAKANFQAACDRGEVKTKSEKSAEKKAIAKLRLQME